MKRLLDANSYVALKRGHGDVAELVRHSSELVFSVVVIGELLFGFRNGRRLAKNTSELEEFLADVRVEVIPVTQTTADRFASLPLRPTIDDQGWVVDRSRCDRSGISSRCE